MKLIKNTRDHPGHLARALPLAAASDIPNVITPRKPLRRVLTSIALPLAALGLGQLVPCAQADVLPVTSGLQCWYDASVGVTTSGTTVTGWDDQSGNGNNATLGAGTPQLGTSQINDRPAVLFRGGNNNLNINKNIIPRQEYIVFKSGRYAFDPGNPNLWGNDWGAPFGQQNDNGWMFESGTRKMWSDGGRRPLAVSQNGTSVLETGNPNGDPYGMANVANYMVLKVNPKNYSAAFGRIGRGNNSWGNGYFDVAEIIVYDRVLTSTEENLIGGYLAGKYQISTAYPPLPLMVSVSSPANNQAYPTNTSVTAVALVPAGAGTGPYSVQFYKKAGADPVAAEGSPVTGAGPTFSLSLGALTDNTYQIYATVTDSASPTQATATSATNTFTVAAPISTTTALGSSPNPSTYGQTVTFTATVSGPPSGGTVQFYFDSSPLGSPVAVNTSTGTASYSTSLLTVATHSITADFSGHGVYLASVADALTQTVNQAVLTVTADNKVRPPGVANPNPFSYKITGYQNGENATSALITGAPVLSCLADESSVVGPYDITSDVGSLTAANYSFTAVNGILTVMVGAPPVANGMVCWFDASNGVDAPGGAISQWNDLSGNGHHAAAAGGTKTLAANQLNGKSAAQFRGGYLNCAGTFFAKEQYVVVRSPYADGWHAYGGFLGRASGRGSNVMMAVDKPTFWNDQSPDAVVKNGTAVTRYAGSNGNYTYNIAPIDTFMLLKIKVNDGNTSTAAYRIANADGNTLPCDIAEIVAYDTALSSTDEAKVGRYLADKYAITATYPLVAPPLAPAGLTAEGLLNSIRLTWPASYSASGYNVYRGTATGVYDPTPIATGVSTIPWTDSPVTAGTPYFYVVKAVNSVGEGAPSPEANATTTSNMVDQTITFGPLASKTYLDPSFDLTATASSFLPVSYEIVAPDPLVVSISGSTVTILKAGTVTIRAIQPGDTEFNAASPVEQTLTVARANQTLTLTLGSGLVRGSDAAPFADTATSTNPSGNPVTYSSSVETVATVDTNGQVSIVGVGTTQIVANQAGDADYYNDAPPVSQTLRVIAAGTLPVINGLVCWFDASQLTGNNGDPVSIWTDLVASKNATTDNASPTLTTGALNGHNVVTFNGSTQDLKVAAGDSPISGKRQFTFVVVFRPHAAGASGANWYNNSGLVDAEQPGSTQDWGLAWNANSQVGAGIGNPDRTLYSAAQPLNTGHVVIYSWDGTNGGAVRLSVDGTTSTTATGATAARNSYQILFGRGSGTNNYFSGDIAEIIGYDTALSPADEAAMTTYLTNKYFATVLTYESWASTKYPSANLTDSAANLDGDGMSNFAEYAFGLNPTTGASLNPVSPLVGKNFSYTRTSDTGLTYKVWHSINLADWYSTLATQGTATSLGGGVESVPVTLDDSLLAEPKLFLRVTAE